MIKELKLEWARSDRNLEVTTAIAKVLVELLKRTTPIDLELEEYRETLAHYAKQEWGEETGVEIFGNKIIVRNFLKGLEKRFE